MAQIIQSFGTQTTFFKVFVQKYYDLKICGDSEYVEELYLASRLRWDFSFA